MVKNPNQIKWRTTNPNQTKRQTNLKKNYKTGGKFKRNNNDIISGGLGHNLQC